MRTQSDSFTIADTLAIAFHTLVSAGFQRILFEIICLYFLLRILFFGSVRRRRYRLSGRAHLYLI